VLCRCLSLLWSMAIVALEQSRIAEELMAPFQAFTDFCLLLSKQAN
jgi:hypothetical protein